MWRPVRTHTRKFAKKFIAMRRISETLCQIGASLVEDLMDSLLPVETAGYIIHRSPVGNVCPGSILTVESAEFLLGKMSHFHSMMEFFRAGIVGRSGTSPALPQI